MRVVERVLYAADSEEAKEAMASSGLALPEPQPEEALPEEIAA
jgi:hypothetical protein